jgi:hypothetical protein
MARIFQKLVPALATAAAVAAAAAGASAGPTAVTFTTPKSGSSVSLKANPYLAVAGGVTFATATAKTTRFYLHRDGCGTSNDNPHLSVQNGDDAGDGCGLVINAVVGSSSGAGARPGHSTTSRPAHRPPTRTAQAPGCSHSSRRWAERSGQARRRSTS